MKRRDRDFRSAAPALSAGRRPTGHPPFPAVSAASAKQGGRIVGTLRMSGLRRNLRRGGRAGKVIAGGSQAAATGGRARAIAGAVDPAGRHGLLDLCRRHAPTGRASPCARDCDRLLSAVENTLLHGHGCQIGKSIVLEYNREEHTVHTTSELADREAAAEAVGGTTRDRRLSPRSPDLHVSDLTIPWSSCAPSPIANWSWPAAPRQHKRAFAQK